MSNDGLIRWFQKFRSYKSKLWFFFVKFVNFFLCIMNVNINIQFMNVIFVMQALHQRSVSIDVLVFGLEGKSRSIMIFVMLVFQKRVI